MLNFGENNGNQLGDGTIISKKTADERVILTGALANRTIVSFFGSTGNTLHFTVTSNWSIIS